MLCARLESVASMLEARSAAVGEAHLRAILLEHQSALEAQQLAAGVKPAGVRISVGYEDIEDIKADFDQAFSASS